MKNRCLFLTVKIVGYNTECGNRLLGQPKRYKFTRKCHEVMSKLIVHLVTTMIV